MFRDFVVRREPWRRWFVLLFLIAAPLAPFLGSERMKSVFLAFLWRMPEDRLASCCRDFAESVMPLIYQEVRAMLENHRKSGDLLVLASASPERYVKEIGDRLGFDLSFGTVVEHGPLFPCLKNHKGHAKVERLRKELAEQFATAGLLPGSHGYTDSVADLPMLGVCETATVVNPKSALKRLARLSGWRVVCPERPWHGPMDRGWRMLCLLLGLGRDPAGRGVTK